jgi:transposase
MKMKKQMTVRKHDYKLMKSIGVDKVLASLNLKMFKTIEARSGYWKKILKK